MKSLSSVEVKNRLKQVELLALDVDGVLTDGGLYYTETGEEFKKFNVKDGLGIKRVIEVGIKVAIITTSQSESVLHRAKKLGIPYVFLGVEDKLAVLQDLCQKLQVDLERVAYIGDDIVDIPVLKAVGCPITVVDAIAENLILSIYITQKPGGCGAVREVCDALLNFKNVGC